MSFDLYSYVELKEDLPEYGLKKGDIGMIIEYYKMPEDQEDGYSLEGFGVDIPGVTIEVGESQIKPVKNYQINTEQKDYAHSLF
jgi:Domain of unknown function (DUF4926)